MLWQFVGFSGKKGEFKQFCRTDTVHGDALRFFVLISRSLTQPGVLDMGCPEISPSCLQVRVLYKSCFRLSIAAFIPPREADHRPLRSNVTCAWYLARLLFRICLRGILRIVVFRRREHWCRSCRNKVRRQTRFFRSSRTLPEAKSKEY